MFEQNVIIEGIVLDKKFIPFSLLQNDIFTSVKIPPFTSVMTHCCSPRR